MKIGIYELQVEHGKKIEINSRANSFLKKIETAGEIKFININENDLRKNDFNIIYVKTGGTETEFLKVYPMLKEPFILLADSEDNSLAASMEIASFLRSKKHKTEIIHGDIGYIVTRINENKKIHDLLNKFHVMKLGVIGKPSDWLIASLVSYGYLYEKFGIQFIDIEMTELEKEIEEKKYPENEFTKNMLNSDFAKEEIEKALWVYGGIRRIIARYGLNGITIRCFDLILKHRISGCIALSLLNSEGIYSSCEGDIPALLSMIILGELTGEYGFMANPSRISMEKNEIVFAHCTLPLNMAVKYNLDTHFETDESIGIKGEIKVGEGTIFKCSGKIDDFFVSDCTIDANLHEKNLCRTQILVKPEKDVKYFLTESIGNHHIICKGKHQVIIENFFSMIKKD